MLEFEELTLLLVKVVLPLLSSGAEVGDSESGDGVSDVEVVDKFDSCRSKIGDSTSLSDLCRFNCFPLVFGIIDTHTQLAFYSMELMKTPSGN